MLAHQAEIWHKQNYDVDKTHPRMVSPCEVSVWTGLRSDRWKLRGLPGSFSFGYRSACVYSASVQGKEGFPLTSVPGGKCKSGSIGYLGLQKPGQGQGNEFHLGADQVMVISGTSLPLGSTG